MTKIATPVTGLLKRTLSAVAVFGGFLSIFFVVGPRISTEGPVPGLTEADVAHADAPYAQGYYQGSYILYGYAQASYGAGDGDGGGGDGCDGDGGDDGDDDG